MKTHLVTGSSGFLGSYIVQKLLDNGDKVIGIDKFENLNFKNKIDFYRVDINDNYKNLVKYFKNVDIVHHNAALVPIMKAGNQFFITNVDGTENVLKASIVSNVEHFSHMSSSAIFGAPKGNENVDVENPSPKEIYGRSKFLAEKKVEKYLSGNSFKSCSIIRPRTVVGPGRLGIFSILFDWVKDDKKIPIIGDGMNKFQFSHPLDLAEVSIETGLRSISGKFNIGVDDYSFLKDDLNNFFLKVGSKSKVFTTNKYLCISMLYLLEKLRLSPLTSYHILVYNKNFHYDLDHAYKKLKWRSKYSNVDVLHEAFVWYKSNYKNISNNNSVHSKILNQKIFKVIKNVF